MTEITAHNHLTQGKNDVLSAKEYTKHIRTKTKETIWDVFGKEIVGERPGEGRPRPQKFQKSKA